MKIFKLCSKSDKSKKNSIVLININRLKQRKALRLSKWTKSNHMSYNKYRMTNIEWLNNLKNNKDIGK